MVYLGIDIGSSSIKGAVLDPSRLTIERPVRRPFPEPLAGLPPRRFEIDPRRVLAEVSAVLEELAAQAPACRGVLFTSQMGGVVLADERGEPLSNYLSWRDERSTSPFPGGTGTYLDAAQARWGDAGLARTGREFKAGGPTALLFWLAENGQLPARGVPLSLGDFVISRLTGAAPATEFTQALGTVDLARRAWCLDLFARLGLDGLRWPELRSVWTPVGSWRGIPCYPAVGDHQAALAGAGLQADELSLNISTGSQVSRLTTTFTPGDYQTRPALDGRYLNTLTHIPAGRSLNVLVDLVTELAGAAGRPIADPWEHIVRAAEAAPDSDLAVDLAFFAGPLGDRGAISHISVENLTVGRLFRAAWRAMAANYERCAVRLSPQRDWRRIVFSGGLAQKLDLLRQFVSERLPGPSRLCTHTEDTLLGLLAVGRVLSGIAPDLEHALPQ